MNVTDKLSFEKYCNEPAFPVPVCTEPDMPELMHSRYPGLTRLEYFVGLFISTDLGQTMQPLKGAARKEIMEQIYYYAEDMLYTIWKKQTGGDPEIKD